MVDFRKACDLVHWDAIAKSLSLMGFDDVFYGLIHTCISSTSFSIIVKGLPMKVFQPKQGLFQRDPLSLLLFATVIEVLSKKLKKAMEVGRDADGVTSGLR